MNVGLDTSLVLRLLTGEPEEQAQCALQEVETLLKTGTTLLVSDLVTAEVYFALHHHYGMPKAEALSMLAIFFADSGVKSIGTAAAVLATPNLATTKPGFVDRLIHADYLRTAPAMLTFERAAARLAGARVLACQTQSPSR